MKYAIIADVHANLEALQAVLQDMKQQGCSHTACLGDIVGYNANPKECLDIIRGMNMPCVKGPKAAYVIYDLDSENIELRRVDYDIPGARGKIEAAGFPRRPR